MPLRLRVAAAGDLAHVHVQEVAAPHAVDERTSRAHARPGLCLDPEQVDAESFDSGDALTRRPLQIGIGQELRLRRLHKSRLLTCGASPAPYPKECWRGGRPLTRRGGASVTSLRLYLYSVPP